jgi:hypothetical protein
MLKYDIDDDDDIINPFKTFMNQMFIQMSSSMIKKNIQKKDDTNVALVDEVRN